MNKQEAYDKAAAEFVASKKNRAKDPQTYEKAKEKMRKARAALREGRTDPGSNGVSETTNGPDDDGSDGESVIVTPATIATSAGVNGPGQ